MKALTSECRSSACPVWGEGWGSRLHSGLYSRRSRPFDSIRTIVSTILFAALISRLPSVAAGREDLKKPNFLIIVADDMGFSDLGCYGGEISTPNLDGLAQNGVRFTQFYNCAVCWPTRSALITGYYPEQVRMNPPDGRPLPKWATTLPRLLKPFGYRSYQSGKWHVLAAPRVCADGGFDHSYLIQDEDRHFNPIFLCEDDRKLPPIPAGTDYYNTTAIADHAIAYLKEHRQKHPDCPFFSYVAFLAPHFPLQAPGADVARYGNRYLKGWDVVRAERYRREKELGIINCALAAPEPTIRASVFPRPGGNLDPGRDASGRPYYIAGSSAMSLIGPGEVAYAIPWKDLTAEQQRFQAAKMAIHAAMVDRIDREIGRILAQVKAMGAWDNTVVFFLSDNGASAQILVRGDGNDRQAPPGSAKSYLCLGPGWATASNTPFRRYKMWVQEGGISTPLIVHWPAGIVGRGELRHTVGHVIDLLPTIFDLASGTAAPPPVPHGAPPLPGRSLVPAFAKDVAIQRNFLCFNCMGDRGLLMGNWKLVSSVTDYNRWFLYDFTDDRAESNDLAAKEPNRVRQMAARWTELETEFRREAEGMTAGKASHAASDGLTFNRSFRTPDPDD